MNGWLIYETEKTPGFSLGLIALAVGNAYVTQLLDIYSIISYITDEESPIEIKNNTSTSNGEYLIT
ncbi:ATPase [Escherichia coli]|nr:ATPase [Escherichia coli]